MEEINHPTPFLKQVAKHYFDSPSISSKVFIFPNRRSIVFFKKYLTSLCKDVPILLPEMLTINDFFCKAAGVNTEDRVHQLIDLYECYRHINPKAESLDEFIFWGDVILGDFNDVDKYLAEPGQLFTNIADMKQMQDDFSYLSPGQREAIENFLSHFRNEAGRLKVDIDSDNPDVKARFLQIWNVLLPLYNEFNSRLLEKGTAYEGMVYRSLVRKMEENGVEEIFRNIFPQADAFVFVGLNALNECEKRLMKKLKDCSMAEFCWDWCSDMIRDPQNRSSFFMKKNVEDFPQAFHIDGGSRKYPVINILSVPSSVGQAKKLPEILTGEGMDWKDAGCAVILPDESLLDPVLNCIPPHIRDINVTMGIPMTSSAFCSLMSSICAMQLHCIQRKGEWHFYHKQVWDVFSNPVFKKTMDKDTGEMVKQVKKAAKYYVPEKELRRGTLAKVIFRQVISDPKSNEQSQVQNLASYLKEVTMALGSGMVSDESLSLEIEFAMHYHQCITSLEDASLQVMPLTFIKLLGQLLNGESVHFKGEPLKGLQIMGPLETRALDFPTLVILSANEGVFPRKSISSSFIPANLRQGFNLPTYEFQDAVWAYYFYRMITRAETVWMLVDSRTEGLKSGEESRYIKQLEYHFGVPLNRMTVQPPMIRSASEPDIIKTEEDIRKMKNMVYSATSIQNYLACPAKFYYSSICNLKAEDEVAESLDAGMFGNVFHSIMQQIYSEAEYIDSLRLNAWLKREEDIREMVMEKIREQMHSFEVEGRNLVSADVITKFVLQTIRRDIEMLRKNNSGGFKMLGCELSIPMDFHGKKMIGIVDRLDSFMDGTIRISDYKTGKVLEQDEMIDSANCEQIVDAIFSPESAERPKIALQFFIYDLLIGYKGYLDGDSVLYHTIYSTARMFKEAPRVVPSCHQFRRLMDERLNELFDSMMDPDVPFRRTEDEKTCSFCDFKMICGR